MKLDEILWDAGRRQAFVRDGVVLIEHEVAGKGGLSGAALKTGFKTIQRLKPGVLAEMLDTMLPHFAPAMAPFVERGVAEGDVSAYFAGHAAEIADALLSVTDARAEHARNRVLIKVYQGLRKTARAHTIDAMPAVGELLARHAYATET